MVKFTLNNVVSFDEFCNVVNGRTTGFRCICGVFNKVSESVEDYVHCVKTYGAFVLACHSCKKRSVLRKDMMVELSENPVIEALIAPSGAIILD